MTSRYILIIEPDKVVTKKRDAFLGPDRENLFAQFLREVAKHHPMARCVVAEVQEDDLWLSEANEWLNWCEVCWEDMPK